MKHSKKALERYADITKEDRQGYKAIPYAEYSIQFYYDHIQGCWMMKETQNGDKLPGRMDLNLFGQYLAVSTLLTEGQRARFRSFCEGYLHRTRHLSNSSALL